MHVDHRRLNVRAPDVALQIGEWPDGGAERPERGQQIGTIGSSFSRRCPSSARPKRRVELVAELVVVERARPSLSRTLDRPCQ